MSVTVYNARDVAAFLGVAPNVVGNWQARYDTTPAATHETRSGRPLWDESGMAAWLVWHARHANKVTAMPGDLDELRKKLLS